VPPTYVFEGLRAIVIDQNFRGDLMLGAFALNCVYFLIAALAFFRLLQSARREGTLMQTGE
jgi:ABC-2 type transport system permease protein